MKVKRIYPCRYDGKEYGEGDTVEVLDKIGERWVKSGSAVLKNGKEKTPDADAKKKVDADAKAKPTVYTEETFRALGWDKAREVAGATYKVHAASWDELIAEFMDAQKKALSKPGGN